MTSNADVSVIIQTPSRSVPATPPWFGEVAHLIPHLRKQRVINTLCAQVPFARHRFGRYEVLDFVAVLSGYAMGRLWCINHRRCGYSLVREVPTTPLYSGRMQGIHELVLNELPRLFHHLVHNFTSGFDLFH